MILAAAMKNHFNGISLQWFIIFQGLKGHDRQIPLLENSIIGIKADRIKGFMTVKMEFSSAWRSWGLLPIQFQLFYLKQA